MVIIEENEYLAHYGVLRRSGRYPGGSSNNQNTRNKSFLDYIDEMKAQGLSDTQIAQGISELDENNKISVARLRDAKTIAKNQVKQAEIGMAQRLKNKGYSNSAIAERMGVSGESYVRSLLAPGAKDKADIYRATSEMLKSRVDVDKYAL